MVEEIKKLQLDFKQITHLVYLINKVWEWENTREISKNIFPEDSEEIIELAKKLGSKYSKKDNFVALNNYFDGLLEEECQRIAKEKPELVDLAKAQLAECSL